ncbi:MAG: PIN domain-containing protein [Syntrophomonadaceae bacterium]|jgi:predicted nucleic acid-binding protein
MLNYPLSVFLDTNIFINAKYDFSGEGILVVLKKHIEAKRVQLYVSNIVVREVQKHICLDVSKLINNFRITQKEAKKIISSNIAKEILLSNLFSSLSEEEIKEAALTKFQEFIIESKAICLDNIGVNIDEILDDYFKGNPPFETKEDKKHEFPDALIISKLKAQFSKDNPVYIISKDEGFKRTLYNTDGFYIYSSIKELLDMINRRSELHDKTTAYLLRKDVYLDICQKLKDKIEFDEVLVDGMDCDRKGYCEGYEYDESYITAVSEVDFQFSSVDDIDDKMVSVTITCDATITAICTYLDENNSIWDSEEKEYMYLQYGTIEEVHQPEFDCILALFIIHDEENIDFSIHNISFDLVLDQNTRISQRSIESEDPRIAAEAEAMDALEEYHRH